MAEDEIKPRRRLAPLAIALSIMLVLMVGPMVVIFREAYTTTNPLVKKGSLLLAWSALVMVLALLVLLLWAFMRWMTDRSRPTGRTHTPYVDAWSIAGKRLKLPDEDSEEESNT